MTHQLAHTTVDIVGSPFLTIWTPEDDVVRAAGFRSQPTDTPIAADELWARLRVSAPELAARGLAAEETHGGPVPTALRAYAAGDTEALDGLGVAQRETPFRGEVLRALRGVPAGRTVTYSELAARAGRPSAVRAAASGCATNLIALIVPCHRIVRSDGGLGGYLFGTEMKQQLLGFEGAQR